MKWLLFNSFFFACIGFIWATFDILGSTGTPIDPSLNDYLNLLFSNSYLGLDYSLFGCIFGIILYGFVSFLKRFLKSK